MGIFKKIYNWWNGEEKVDLGLSVEWATESLNVAYINGGLSGRLSRWGDHMTSYKEPSPHSTKTFDELVEEGVITANGNLTPEYDIVAQTSGIVDRCWRIPTVREMEELIEKCEWELISKHGLVGMKVTGPNGRYIMLHAGGYWNPESLETSHGVSDASYNRVGLFWTSSAIKEDPEHAWALWFTTNGDIDIAAASKTLFAQVIPVYDKRA